MFKVLILLISIIFALFFFGNGWFKSGEKWYHVADLPEKFTVECVSVGDNGLRLIGGYYNTLPSDASLTARMTHRKALLWRLEGKTLEKVYEEKGYIIADYQEYLESKWICPAPDAWDALSMRN